MSSSFGYLIPSKTFDVGQFKNALVSILEKKKIIDGYYEKKYQWYAAAEDSHSIFTESEDEENPGFEYLEIHDTINNRLIPDCTSDNYGAKCINCKTNLDDILSEALFALAETESESGEETDMALLVVVCSNCQHNNPIQNIPFDLEVRVTNQFACFVEIDNEFDDQMIAELSLLLDCKLDIVYGTF